MPLIRDWEKDIAEMPDEKLIRTAKALDTLFTWKLYKETYPEISTLKFMIVHEQDNRK